VLGRAAYTSLAAIGRPIDLAVICAPSAAVPDILTLRPGQLRGQRFLRMRRAVIPTPTNAGGARWPSALGRRGCAFLDRQASGSCDLARSQRDRWRGARAARTPVADLAVGRDGDGPARFRADRGHRFASVVAFGAGSDVETSELLEFALTDPETDGIVLYLETVKDARRFMSALRVAARAKPVVVLKAGRGDAPASAHAPAPIACSTPR